MNRSGSGDAPATTPLLTLGRLGAVALGGLAHGALVATAVAGTVLETPVGSWLAHRSTLGPHAAGLLERLLTSGTAWAGLTVLACACFAGRRSTWARLLPLVSAAGVLFLVGATAGWTIAQQAHGLATSTPWTSGPPSPFGHWLALVALLGPVLGLLGGIAARPTLPGTLVRTLLPLVAVVEVLAQSPRGRGPQSWLDLAAALVLLGAGTLVAILALALGRRAGTSAGPAVARSGTSRQAAESAPEPTGCTSTTSPVLRSRGVDVRPAGPGSAPTRTPVASGRRGRRSRADQPPVAAGR